MLPLIVGQIEGPSDEPEDAELIEDDDAIESEGSAAASGVEEEPTDDTSVETANADTPPVEEQPLRKDVK